MISSETLLTVLLPSFFGILNSMTERQQVSTNDFSGARGTDFSPTRSRRYERDRPMGRRDGPGRVHARLTWII